MRVFISAIAVILGLFFSGTCSPRSDAAGLLSDARRLVEEDPDSAMLLIDSIFYPEHSLGRGDYMRFFGNAGAGKIQDFPPGK